MCTCLCMHHHYLSLFEIIENTKNDRNKMKKIVGLKFKKISRRSKYLLFYFNKDIVMLVHLGMTGKFFFINPKKIKLKTSFYYDINYDKDEKHDRLIFDLSNNQKLIKLR